MNSETSWPEVLVRMVDGPGHAISLRGTIRSRNGRHQPGNFGGWATMGDQARPQFTGNFSRAREPSTMCGAPARRCEWKIRTVTRC
ncbi:hypothetical protein [Rhodococcus jostii]|uniref:hypothetical protein n=1 Tax=Rhodococcus jostii TaxID=132919 RepID=UPI003669FF3B